MQGLKDLFDSERGVFCVLLLIATTVFVIVGKMTIEQWIAFQQLNMVALIGSKTATGIAETVMAGKRPPASSPPAAPPPA